MAGRIRFRRRWLPHAVASVALISLFVVSALLWFEVKKRFPQLEPGSYLGSVEGVFQDDLSSRTRIYVERTSDSEDLLFVVLRSGWQPQLVTAVVRGARSDDAEWLLPVTVVGPEGKLRFIGHRVGPDEYRGSVTNTEGGVEGSWTLASIRAEGPQTPQELDEVRLWLSLRTELLHVERLIAQAEERIPEQKTEIERLTGFITERERLRLRADEKFQEATKELSTAKQSLQDKQDEARRLQETVELSHRVTPMGKLVALSREALEREGRWIESMFRTAVGGSSELDAAVDKGKRILELKRLIELEKERLQGNHREVQERTSEESDTPAAHGLAEEEFND